MSDNIEEEQPEEEKPNLKDDLTDIGGEILKKRIAKSGASKAAGAGVKAGGNAAASSVASGAAEAAGAAGASSAASGAAGSLASAGSSAIAGAGAGASVAGAAIGEVKNLGEAVKEGDATGVVDSGVRVAGVGAATYFGGAAGGAAASAVLDTEIGKKTTRGLSTIVVGAVVVLFSMLVLLIGIISYSSIAVVTTVIFPGNGMQFASGGSSAGGNYASCTIDSCTVDFSKVDKRFVTLSGKPTSFKDGGTNEESKIRVDRALSVVGNASKACCDGQCLNWCGCLSSWIGGHYGSGYATAHIQWYGMISKGVAHPGDRNPPVGALLFWSNGGTTSNDFGHVATYVGSGLAVGNVSGGPGGANVYLHDADAPERWGQQYLGWSENVFTSGVMDPDRPTCGCG